MNTQRMNDPIVLAARILLAILFVVAGWGKVMGYASTQTYMAAGGVPGALLPLVIISEIGGGLLVAFGWQTRIVAILLAGFTVLTAIFFHSAAAQQTQLMKNLAITGGFLLLFVIGPGRYSLDGWTSKPASAE